MGTEKWGGNLRVGDEEPEVKEDMAGERSSRTQRTVYDAVAGRLGRDGLVKSQEKPMPPDQVLFSRKNAPVRYEEDDFYFAHRHLTADQELPDSDLLKAIHTYAADYYGSGIVGEARDDFGSLDETALLTMGILLEEAARYALGKSGALAFVDGLEEEGPSDDL